MRVAVVVVERYLVCVVVRRLDGGLSGDELDSMVSCRGGVSRVLDEWPLRRNGLAEEAPLREKARRRGRPESW